MGKAFPWREALLVNGLFSSALGLAALVLVRLYGADLHRWLRDQPPEKAQAVGEVVVLCYLAYAVGLVVVAMGSFLMAGWFARRGDPEQQPARTGHDDR